MHVKPCSVPPSKIQKLVQGQAGSPVRAMRFETTLVRDADKEKMFLPAVALMNATRSRINEVA